METITDKQLNELIDYQEKKMDWKLVFALLELKSYRAKEKWLQNGNGEKKL